MQTETMISADEFCIYANVELSFIYLLGKSGLIEIITIEEKNYLHTSELAHLEKLVRLYYDMDINVEGIETITHLLQRMNEMQQQIKTLRNKLNWYENG